MKTPFKRCTLQEAEVLLNEGEVLFSDTETCGFYQKIRLLQAYQPHLEHVLLIDWPNEYAITAFLDKYTTAWHNSHYDITTVQQQTGTRWIPNKFEDTFLLSRLAFPDKEKFSLDETMQYVLGFDPYARQLLDKKKLQKSKWDSNFLTEDQLLYAATDVYYMPQVWEAVKSKLEEFSYKLDMLTLKYCLDFQWNGMPTTEDGLYNKHKENLQVIEEANVPVNVNSWQQVRSYLNATESDDLALATMAMDGNDKAANVRKVRKLKKQNSFIEKFETSDNRIYGKFLPSARSGRLTSKDQNLQQLPRALKGMFQAPPGRVLIYADYAQLELRTICAIVNCTVMAELFREGADLHAHTAEMVFGKNWTKADRQLSKTYNFLLLYGGGITMLLGILMKQDILISEQQATRDRRKWRLLWKEIYGWQQEGIAKWTKGKLNYTPLGRYYKAKMMTDFLSIENQGAGAEVAKLALHYFYPRMIAYNEEHGTDFILCNFIHDSFITEGPDDPVHYKAMAKIKAEAMQEAWFEMSKLFKITDLPMPVDVAVGTNWGDIENDDVDNIWNYQLEGMALCKDSK